MSRDRWRLGRLAAIVALAMLPITAFAQTRSGGFAATVADQAGQVCVDSLGHARPVAPAQPCWASERRVGQRKLSGMGLDSRIVVASLSAPMVAPLPLGHAGQEGEGVIETENQRLTAIGWQALYSNTTGGDNTASGFQALYSNTEASFNTATGSSALFSNTTGGANTASGYHALHSNTTGYRNTANGYRALHTNTTGIDNTAMGFGALGSNEGSSNNAIGVYSLTANTTGHGNTRRAAATSGTASSR
jgi:hypothetical protein